MKSIAIAMILTSLASVTFAQETCLDLSGCYAGQAEGQLGITRLLSVEQYKCSSIEIKSGDTVPLKSGLKLLPGAKLEVRYQTSEIKSAEDYGLEYSRYKTFFDGNGEMVKAEKDVPPSPPFAYTRMTTIVRKGAQACGAATDAGKEYLVITSTSDYDNSVLSCNKFERQAPAACEAFKKERDMPVNSGEIGSCTGKIVRIEDSYYPENGTIERVGKYVFKANLIQTGSSEVTALIHEASRNVSHIFKRRFMYFAQVDPTDGSYKMILSQKGEGSVNSPQITGTLSKSSKDELVMTAPSDTDSFEKYSDVTCTLK